MSFCQRVCFMPLQQSSLRCAVAMAVWTGCAVLRCDLLTRTCWQQLDCPMRTTITSDTSNCRLTSRCKITVIPGWGQLPSIVLTLKVPYSCCLIVLWSCAQVASGSDANQASFSSFWCQWSAWRWTSWLWSSVWTVRLCVLHFYLFIYVCLYLFKQVFY